MYENTKQEIFNHMETETHNENGPNMETHI